MKNKESEKKQWQLIDGIAHGEKAITQGRTYTQKEAKKKMSKWLK
jgi:predicted transcriptional regulator